MKIYNKLVRDKIPEIIKKSGNKPLTRVLSDEEYITALDKKLVEEVGEYIESRSIEELADICEVLLAILEARGFSPEELESVRKEKAEARGGFADKLFLEYVEEKQ